MRRIALAAVLAAMMAPAAQATHERDDRIPYSVGPADFRGYHVNPTANVPANVDAERWHLVARRSLERWGATYLGTTTASPDVDDDGLNVIGFSNSSQLGGSVIGLNAKSKGGLRRTPAGGETCAVAPNMGTTQSVSPVPSTLRFRLRSDRLRKGKVRRRTLTKTRELTAPRIDSAPVSGQKCTGVVPGTESDPQTVEQESDVLMDASVPNWFAGPGAVPADKLDLETVLLHELGHAAGLAHQLQECDPSTPMPASGGAGEYWRGVDEVLFGSRCPKPYVVTADPAHGAEPPLAGGAHTLGGRGFHVNPAVPEGYDSERFVAVAKTVVGRWGGTFAGLTDAKPTQGDGLNVIGFDTIALPSFEVTNRSTTERSVYPAYRTCTIIPGQIPSFRVKKVTRKVRVAGRRKKLELRRDRLVQTSVIGPASGQCADHPSESKADAPQVETDIGIAHEMDAYEMGPAHPVHGTRVDMATLLASALGQAAGVAPSDRCATGTPVTVSIDPGDWWHGPDDFNRVDCAARRAAARPAATEPASGFVRFVQVQD